MDKDDATKRIQELADKLLGDPEVIRMYLAEITGNKGTLKYEYEKAIRLASDIDAEALLPFFDELVGLLRHPNNFIKWGAIVTVANLLSATDLEQERIYYEELMKLLGDESMITASNAAAGCLKLIRSHPEREPEITARLLAMEGQSFLMKGVVSDECRNILCGHLLEVFDQYAGSSGRVGDMVEFARRCLGNSRKAVVRKAVAFLEKHGSDSEQRC